MKTDLEFYRERAARGIRLWASTQAKPLYENVAYRRWGVGLRRDEFNEMVAALHEEGALELMDGKVYGVRLLVPKSQAEAVAAGRLSV